MLSSRSGSAGVAFACGWLALGGCAASAEEPGQAQAALVVEPGWQRVIALGEGSVSSSGVASDRAGDAVVSGHVLKPLLGSARASSDAFVAKYSSAGRLLWSRELGSADSDGAAGVSVDHAGHVLIAGDTSGALEGAQLGLGDAFVARYSSAGELDWTRQLGTAQPDAARGVSVDAAGNVLVAGFTQGALAVLRDGTDADVWVAKYSPGGELLWLRQLGSRAGYDEQAAGVSADGAGNVLVAGYGFGPLERESQGSADAFVGKLSPDGELLWVRQAGGAGYDAAAAVSADAAGNVYVAGQRGGVLTGGPGVVLPGEPFVAKYSPVGELLWELGLEAAAMGSVSSISTGPDGALWIAGFGSGDWAGPNLGLYDTFLAQLSESGEVRWALPLGVEELDRATGVSADGRGHVYVTRDVRNADPDGSDRALLARQRSPQLRSN